MTKFRQLDNKKSDTGWRQVFLSPALLKKKFDMDEKRSKGWVEQMRWILDKGSEIAEQIGLWLATASGFVMLFSLLVGVGTRWLPFMTSAIWSEEIARMCMLWLTTNGASVAYRRLEMVKFNLLTDILPVKIRYILEVISNVCVLIVLMILLKYGYEMLILKSKVEAAATHISYFWWALGLYIGFLLMLVHAVRFLFESLAQGSQIMKGGERP